MKKEPSFYSGFILLCYWSSLIVLICIRSLCYSDDKFLLGRSDVTDLVLLMSLSTMRLVHHSEHALNGIRMNQKTKQLVPMFRFEVRYVQYAPRAALSGAFSEHHCHCAN